MPSGVALGFYQGKSPVSSTEIGVPMGDLSDHFSKSEFVDHRTGALPQGFPDPRLVELLERIRSSAPNNGRPLRIVSGYRSVETNRAVGGAVDSQHLYGRAADLVPGVCTVAEALHLGATGVGHRADGWVVHVDVRPGQAVTFIDG